MNFNKFNPFRSQLERLVKRYGGEGNPQDQNALAQIKYLTEMADAWDKKRGQIYSSGSLGLAEKYPFFLSGTFNITNPQ